jgi:hypothetical protein
LSRRFQEVAAYLRRNKLRIWFAASLGALLFMSGVALGVFGVTSRIGMTFAAGVKDWVEFPAHRVGLRPQKWLKSARHSGRGVVLHRDSAYPGQTFISGFFGDSPGMRLIDMDGRTLHEWRASFTKIWPDTSHVEIKPPRTDWDGQIHGAILYPDGDVIFNFQYAGLARIDQCSRVRWKLPLQTHHSIVRASDGTLWVPSRRLRRTAVPRFPQIPAPFMEEFLVQISPEGKVLREISILDIVYGSRYEGLLFPSGAHDVQPDMPPDGDFTHLNDIEVLEPELAGAFPQFTAGDLLLSLRNLDLLLVVSPQTRRIKWAMTGPFVRQHDPDFLPSGHIVVFDNRRDSRDGKALGGSRILQVDPVTRQTVVLYGEREKEFFYTETMGEQQWLPNGNLLITESEYGHAFEVDREGRMVWEFINRWDDELVAQTAGATRYPDGYMVASTKRNCS